MQNFKKIILMVVIFLGMEKIAEFLVVPITFQHGLEQELQALEKQGIFPNMVLLGDSMVIYDLAPTVMEDAMDESICILNAGTSSQKPWGSYYYLKDLLKEYPLKYVVLGVDYWAYSVEKRGITRELLIMSRLKHPTVKLEYCFNILEPEEYPYLLKSYANREGVENIGYYLKRKLTGAYLFGTGKDFTKGKLNRGHEKFDEGRGEFRVGIERLGPFENDSIDPLAGEYLDKIMKLCRKEGVKLYIVGMPMASTTVFASKSYEDFYDYIQKAAAKNDVTFWDLNLLKDRMTVIPDGMMADICHVGAPGDQRISKKMGKLLQKDMEGLDVSEAFYPSVTAWKKSVEGIVGCSLSVKALEGSAEQLITGESIQADGIVPEYEFWISTEGEDKGWTRLRNYARESECVLPEEYADKELWIKICSRRTGSISPYEKCYVKELHPDGKE